MDSLTPGFLACIVAVIGLVGMIAALVAIIGVSKEKSLILKGIPRLTAMTATIAAKTVSPIDWMASESLRCDSHFGDCIMAVWGGWLVGRVPTLAELHNLAARRERRRLSARIAGGITGLLVVAGIAGTLASMHPILGRFKITVSSNGEGPNSSERADSANDMVQGLRNAFVPSLTALLITVFLAGARGIYVHKASGLAWDLDRLAIDTLFPLFPPRTFGEELAEVQTDLRELITSIELRDKQLLHLIKSLGPTAAGLQEIEPRMQTATASFTAETNRVFAELVNHLGAKSSVAKTLASIEALATAGQEVASQLTAASSAFAKSSDRTVRRMEETGKIFQTISFSVPERIEQVFADAGGNLVATSGRAASEAAALIAESGERAAANLYEQVAAIPQQINDGCANGTQLVVQACSKAAANAGAIVAQAGAVLTETVKEQTVPLTAAAGEIVAANTALHTDVRRDLESTIRKFDQSSAVVLGHFRDTISTTVTQIDAAQEGAATAVAAADEVVTRAEKIHASAHRFSNFWRWVRGKDQPRRR